MRILLLLVAIALVGCPSTRPKQETTAVEKTKTKKKKKKEQKKKKKDVAVVDEPKVVDGERVVEVIEGRAVWYGKDWHGKKTASGERFDMHKMTAAHRSLKMGTRVRVTNTRNGKSVIVRINDRGPYGKDKRRIIDVSHAAAEKLDFVDAGWCPVTLEVLADDEETE